jgi:hypothetical protein
VGRSPGTGRDRKLIDFLDLLPHPAEDWDVMHAQLIISRRVG